MRIFFLFIFDIIADQQLRGNSDLFQCADCGGSFLRKNCLIYATSEKLLYKCLACDNMKNKANADSDKLKSKMNEKKSFDTNSYLCTCCHQLFDDRRKVVLFQMQKYDLSSYPASICLLRKFRKRLGVKEYICKDCHEDLKIGSVSPKVPVYAACAVYDEKEKSAHQPSDFDWYGSINSLRKSDNFEDFKERVLAMNFPPLPKEPVGNVCLKNYTKDIFAYNSIPDNCVIPKRLAYPVHTTGDGSCFLNALSRIWYGNEYHATEMRLRLVHEGVKNMDLYLDRSYLSRGFQHSYRREGFDIVELYRAFGNDNLQQYKGADFYKQELWCVSKIGTYCGVWQFHQAANVLNYNIRGVYPDEGSVKDHLDRWFMPRGVSSVNEIGDKFVTIMWTKSSARDRKPNHFVPIVRYVLSIKLC